MVAAAKLLLFVRGARHRFLLIRNSPVVNPPFLPRHLATLPSPPPPQPHHPSSTPSFPSAVAASAPGSEKKEKWRWSAILLFLPGLVTLGLGTWQLQRRQWKIELLEYRRRRLAEDVVPLHKALDETLYLSASQFQPEDLKESRDDLLRSLEFRRVMCEGKLEEAKSLFLGPRSRPINGVTQKGYFMVTPLIPLQARDEGVQVPVLVNRGWVPSSWRDAIPKSTSDVPSPNFSSERNKPNRGFWSFILGRKQETVKDTMPGEKSVKVVGVIRGSEDPNMFVPPNVPESGEWFYIDVPAMVKAAGLPEGTIYIEAMQEDSDTTASKDYPIPKDPDALVQSSVMPQDHMNYALTWFTLSAATLYMARKRLQKKPF